jgi:diguanylate cyclase (GGDEF)-like protein
VETPEEKSEVLRRIAEQSGVAVVLLDNDSREVLSSNNNSICSILYPSQEFGPRCAEYCGLAFAKASEAGAPIEYKCHAGLECKAVMLRNGGQQLVAITGRVFTKAEDYRTATERSLDGDWQKFPPSEFFGNVLLGGSDRKVSGAVRALESLSDSEKDELFAAAGSFGSDDALDASGSSETPELTAPVEPETPREVESVKRPIAAVQPLFQSVEVSAWRSLFGSLLELDYRRAAEAVLQFIGKRYDLASLMWLERAGDRFEAVAGRGDLRDLAVKLAVSPDDRRLARAASRDQFLELRERSRTDKPSEHRSLKILPLMIGKTVESALAAAGELPAEPQLREIARFCQTVMPQLEILRLRSEVERRSSIDEAVKRFHDGMKNAEGPDFWMQLTQSSAELLQAERASLLVRKEKLPGLRAIATVGLRADLSNERNVGSRVSQLTLESGKPLLVKDVHSLALAPAESARNYKTDSFISFPIAVGTRGIAVMNFADKVGGEIFNEYDMQLLQAIAPQITIAIDRAALKEQAGTYAQLSVTDPLTGLLNRRYLEARLSEEIQRSNRHGFPMSFMLLDVDKFKSYNDRFGHLVGDEALKLVGRILKDTVRGADVPARYGGEEFAVLLPQTTSDEALVIAERIRERIEGAPFPNRTVTVSIGIASCSSSVNSMKALVGAADKALYQAKRTGRNNVKRFGISTSEHWTNN